jgi:hypothetical protein
MDYTPILEEGAGRVKIGSKKDAEALLKAVQSGSAGDVEDQVRALFPNLEGFSIPLKGAKVIGALNDDMNAARELQKLWLPDTCTFEVYSSVVYVNTPLTQYAWHGTDKDGNTGRAWLIAILEAVIGIFDGEDVSYSHLTS